MPSSNERLFRGFTDIEKRPQISLQAILMSLFAMPLLGLKSLLSNDREARTSRYKKLFGSDRRWWPRTPPLLAY